MPTNILQIYTYNQICSQIQFVFGPNLMDWVLVRMQWSISIIYHHCHVVKLLHITWLYFWWGIQFKWPASWTDCSSYITSWIDPHLARPRGKNLSTKYNNNDNKIKQQQWQEDKKQQQWRKQDKKQQQEQPVNKILQLSNQVEPRSKPGLSAEHQFVKKSHKTFVSTNKAWSYFPIRWWLILVWSCCCCSCFFLFLFFLKLDYDWYLCEFSN